MKEQFRLTDFGKAISLGQAISYLYSHGWKIHINERPIRCEGPEDDAGQPIVAFVPSDDKLVDFPLRLEDLIILLSQLEERPAGAIANDIASIRDANEAVPPKLVDFVNILKAHVRNRQSSPIGESYVQTMVALAENVELAFGGGRTMAVALLLGTFAKMHGEFEEPRLLLWRLTEWAGVILKEPTPKKLDKLYQLAFSSSADYESLFDWLNENTVVEVGVVDQPKST